MEMLGKFATAVVVALGGAVDAVATPLARPNLVVVVADDAGWGDFSFVGNASVATPAVDSLAHDGAYVQGRGYIADDITDHAIGFINDSQQGGKKPFLCYVAFNTPHSPMSVPEAEWNRLADQPIDQRGPEGDREDLAFTRAALAMVENLDTNVGRLLATLDRLDLARDTIVVFLSDNGPNSSRWCGGMRGKKGSTDDGGVRSVCCIRYPARIQPGTIIDDVTGAIDLLPTLAGLAGVTLNNKKPLDGVDLAPLLCRGREARTSAAALADRAIVASFGGRVSVRTTRHRLDAEGRLYDLEHDPGQTRDLAADRPDVADRLRGIAAAWRRDVLDAAPKPTEERFPVGYPGAPLTELPARDGVPHGGVARSGKAPNCSYFTTWKSPEDSITWTVDVLAPGSYSAELWYTCPPADTGATVTLSGGGGTVTGTIHPGWDPPLNTADDRIPRGHGEGFSKAFRPLALGTITLDKGPTTLVLRATTIPGGSVADIRRLVLRPAR